MGAPFFNKVNIPIGLLLLFLTGRWAAAGVAEDFDRELEAKFWLATDFEFGRWARLLFALGLREFYSLVCLILCVFVAATIGMEFYRGARVRACAVADRRGRLRRSI